MSGTRLIDRRVRLERERSPGDKLAVVRAAVDLDNSIRGEEDTRRLGVPAGLDLVSRTREVEEHVARRYTLQHNVRTAIQLQPLGNIEDEGV